MRIFAWLRKSSPDARKRELAQDLSIVWRGLVTSAPPNATLEAIVEQFGARIPAVLGRYYQDIFAISRQPGQEDFLRTIAMEAIHLSGAHSDKDLAEIRRHMGIK